MVVAEVSNVPLAQKIGSKRCLGPVLKSGVEGKWGNPNWNAGPQHLRSGELVGKEVRGGANGEPRQAQRVR